MNRSALLAVAFLAIAITGICAWKFSAGAAPTISRQAQNHILHGDKSGGGHLYGTNKPCKTEFPKDWDEAEILKNVKKVAANDNLKWKKESNGYYVANEKVGDVNVRVVLDKERDDVVTAYPTNGKANVCKTTPHKKAASTRKAVSPEAKRAAANDNNVSVMPNASNRQPRTSNINQR